MKDERRRESFSSAGNFVPTGSNGLVDELVVAVEVQLVVVRPVVLKELAQLDEEVLPLSLVN